MSGLTSSCKHLGNYYREETCPVKMEYLSHAKCSVRHELKRGVEWLLGGGVSAITLVGEGKEYESRNFYFARICADLKNFS